MKKNNIKSGFTFIELILVITIFALIFGVTITSFGNILNEKTMMTKRNEIIQDLRESRTNAISQKLNSSWGVYLDTASNPDCYIVFKGSSYLGRDSSYDRVVELPTSITFSNINLGGGQELVFVKRTGQVVTSGNFQLASDEEVYNIYINSFGVIDYSE